MTIGSLTASIRHYEFGDFVLDSARRDLWHRDGALVPVTPRIFNALALFVEHPYELLGKDWLMASLWPGLVVEENNLSQVVFALRRALGCDGRRYIRTETRRGFRFVCAVAKFADSRALKSQASPIALHTPAWPLPRFFTS